MKTLENRFWTKVDKRGPDECWLWTAAACGRDYKEDGYGHIRISGKFYKSHRVAWELLIGPIPEGVQIDHLCHVRRCVNTAHMRLVTPKQNMENQAGAKRHNRSSVHRGVSFREDRRKWRAQIQHFGKRYSSTHDTEAEAAEAAIKIRRQLFTHNDHDRLPDEPGHLVGGLA